MNLLSTRDEIVCEVHRKCLKPQGFSLRGLRSEAHSPPLHRGLIAHSQPWNTQGQVDFDLLIIIAHDDYRPNALYGVRPGLGPRDDALLSLSLCRMSDRGSPFWSLGSTDDSAAVEAEIHRAIETYAVPSFERASTLEGVLELLAELGGVRVFKAHSWVLDRLGKRDAAIKVVKAAVEDAPHAKAKGAALDWLARFNGSPPISA